MEALPPAAGLARGMHFYSFLGPYINSCDSTVEALPPVAREPITRASSPCRRHVDLKSISRRSHMKSSQTQAREMYGSGAWPRWVRDCLRAVSGQTRLSRETVCPRAASVSDAPL